MTRVVVVGSGGREHALADVLGRTAESVVVTPGNPGIPGSVETPATELEADLFVIGPEVPLVEGLADELRAQGKLVFGPGRDGAQLEGSKAWMKELFAVAGVPTAAYGSFTEVDLALAYLAGMSAPFVIKTDGLAAGKGVVVTNDRAEAEAAVRSYLSGEAFGDAGSTVVIEEGLTGPEVSVFAVCDGHRAVLLAPAQDHKRIFDNDEGPNTGGMGAYTPLPWADAGLLEMVEREAINPTLAELRRRGIDYRGVLYAGLMLTPDGPKMLEYNVRFGDPETQVVLPRIDSDLVQLLMEAAAGNIESEPTFSNDAHVIVVCASEGYPASPRTGDVIYGIDAARAIDGVSVYAAGVKENAAGELITGGGRVLNVVGRGRSVDEAVAKAYEGVAAIEFPGMHVRSDIAAQARES
jgi:phosphoribosylamine--glycine ligase